MTCELAARCIACVFVSILYIHAYRPYSSSQVVKNIVTHSSCMEYTRARYRKHEGGVGLSQPRVCEESRWVLGECCPFFCLSECECSSKGGARGRQKNQMPYELRITNYKFAK